MAKFAGFQSAPVRLGELRGLAGGQYIRIVAGILASPALARGLGTEGRGAWALIMLYDLTSTLVLSRGTPNAFGFHYLRVRSDQGQHEQPFAYATWALRRIAGLSAVLGTAFLAALVVLDATSPLLIAIGVLTLTTPLATMHLCARQYAAVSHQDELVLRLDAVPAVLQAACFVLLFAAGFLTITSALVVVVVVRSTAAVMGARVWPLAMSQQPTAEFTRYGWRAFPTALGQLAQGRFEQLAVLAISQSAVGIFAVGGVIAGLPVPLFRATGQQLFRRDDLQPGSWRKAIRQMGVVWLLAIAGAVAGLWVVPVVYGSDYSEAAVIALILAIGSIGEGLFICCRAWMDRRGYPGRSSVIGLIHIGLILIIVPVVATVAGLYAVAIASALLQLLRGLTSLAVRYRLER